MRKNFRRAIAIATGLLLAVPMGVNLRSETEAAEVQAEFYVSPTGSDSGDGSESSPFASIEAARDAVRKINGSMSGDINVYLHGGDYRVTSAIEFDTRDSGTNGYHINYKAVPGETPVLNGATKVTGWTKFNDKLWSAPLNRNIKLRNLYVNDQRANMGSVRVEAKGGWGDYNITAGQADWAWDSGKKSDGIKYDAGNIPRVTSNFDDLEAVNGTTWNENIVCSRDIKYDGNTMIFLMQQPYGAIAQTPGWGAGFSTGGWHTVFNAFSFVDEPGEFYFDKTDKVLYYYPRNGEDMTTADVEAPTATQLITIAGKDKKTHVKNINFSGITFANTDYQLTDVAGSHGKTTCQAAQTYTAFADSNWHSKKYEMVDTLPAMIHITSSDNIDFTGNVIKHSGADGLSMTNDVTDSNISGNYITDITSSGITIGHPQHIYIGDKSWNNREKFDADVEGICKNDTVTNNFLYDISVVPGFGGCAAVTAYFVESVKINSNTIEKTAYNGIHLGWGWCNFKDSTTCHDNEICYNRVINCLNRLHDSGGIYTIGQMPGTVINENYVRGIPAGGFGAPTYGLHNDEGTTYIVENDNVLDIDPNVTYTINCEDYGQKHHLTIKRTYATVNKMGKNPPDSDIDTPIVVKDNVWPLAQYKVCLNSGVAPEYSGLVPRWLVSAADYSFPASCATTCGSKLPVRSCGLTLWAAPDNTTVFEKSDTMTKASAGKTEIKTPKKAGEYRIYAVDADGKVVSKSSFILRVSGSGGGNVIEAESYTDNSGTQTENCSEGGSDVGYIQNGSYLGYKDVDFGSGSSSLSVRVGAQYGGSSFEVHLGSPSGTLIGKADVGSTGGWQTWDTVTCNITKTSGKQNVYFVFKGGGGYLFNVNWWSVDGVELEEDDDDDEEETTEPTTEAPTEPPVDHTGDVNGDGSKSASDYVMFHRWLVKDGSITTPENADMNGDGKVNIIDLMILKNMLFTMK